MIQSLVGEKEEDFNNISFIFFLIKNKVIN